MAREYFKKLQEAKGSRSVFSNSACQTQDRYCKPIVVVVWDIKTNTLSDVKALCLKLACLSLTNKEFGFS
jgi:hypothetical protein